MNMDITPIYHQLLKAEASLIVGAINDILAKAEAEFNYLIKPPHTGRASDDKIRAGSIKYAFEGPVRRHASSIARALQTELSVEDPDKLIRVIENVTLGESSGASIELLNTITKSITELAAKL